MRFEEEFRRLGGKKGQDGPAPFMSSFEKPVRDMAGINRNRWPEWSGTHIRRRVPSNFGSP